MIQQLKCISRIGLFMFCVVMFLAGCSTNALTDDTDSITEHVPSITPNVLSEQEIHTPQVATSLPPSPTAPIASSSVTYTATPTILLEEAPASTIPPSLPPEEAKAFVLALTENNGGCLLPCFWGFTPGETTWQIAEPQLTTFAYQIYYGTQDGTFSDIPTGTAFIAWVYLYFLEISPVPISYVFTVQDGIITMIEAHIIPTPSYSVSSVLDAYGQPTEIWLLTANSSREGVHGFVTTLFYGQHGFMLRYGSQGTLEEGVVQTCFSEQTFDEMVLVTWSSDEQLTYAEVVTRTVSFGTIEYDRSLEEATGMDLSNFYEAVRGEGGPVCLETPADLWPGP